MQEEIAFVFICMIMLVILAETIFRTILSVLTLCEPGQL